MPVPNRREAGRREQAKRDKEEAPTHLPKTPRTFVRGMQGKQGLIPSELYPISPELRVSLRESPRKTGDKI